MEEEDAAPEVSESITNRDAAEIEKKESEAGVKEDGKEGVAQTEEDKAEEKAESNKMEMDKKEIEEGEGKKDQDEEEKKENKVEGDNEEIKDEAMEEDEEDKMNEENDGKVETEVDEVKEENENEEVKEEKEDVKQVKMSKKRSQRRSSTGKKDKKNKKEEQPRIPVTPASDRPVRERKSVERFVAAIVNDAAKEFRVEKGRGTALKDIPNVAYKLSRKKTDDTFKLLHTVLFGRRGKAAQIKTNISRFSGFVWHDNEEKQKIKVKEKLDKCVKEKLVEICDVLDIPIAKTTTKKEDIVVKLIEFLEAPHATTTELLAEKEQPSKGKKRKRVSKRSGSSSGITPSKRSAKIQRRTESASKKGEKKNIPESEDESDEEVEEEDEEQEEAHLEENVNGVPEKSEGEMSEQAESEEKEDESEEEKIKRKSVSRKTPTKKGSVGNAKGRTVGSSKKSSPVPKSTPSKTRTASNRSKASDKNGSNPKMPSKKKKTEVVKVKFPTPKKSASKESAGKKVDKGKDKPKEDKLNPSDDELRNSICEILKEVDFNTATFTDILKQLAKRFDVDLTPRKSSIKLMIQEELTKLADEGEEEEEEGDAEKDEIQPPGQGVKA